MKAPNWEKLKAAVDTLEEQFCAVALRAKHSEDILANRLEIAVVSLNDARDYLTEYEKTWPKPE